MAPKNEQARDFLTSRRAKITPDMAGLPVNGTYRRVPGLRREEVALLAGVSVDYYTRLEKGNLSGVSEDVLDAVSKALQLSDDERIYLLDLARLANAAGRPTRTVPRRRPVPQLRENVQRLVDAMATAAVIAHDQRLDIYGANALGRALFSPVFHSPTRSTDTTRPNLARFVFLDPAATSFYPDIDSAAASCVATLRAQAGHDPYDINLTGLIGELSTRSADFRARWAKHDVIAHRAGTKTIRHPDVGDLHLGFEQLDVASETGLTLSVYVADPTTPSGERLQLLANLAISENAAPQH
ncbi:helix-turn-helix domain-containing protein [Microbacterium oxydans]|uniref:helix-turn-helix domain-containing protein n=1 Tax=Microbacterium oxydans TaxID=82380 RepID=UPI000F8FBBD6|nr:helix-turn-helix transcriptional regulator [Microbacterium oxydans]AZS47991.1 hypothetical protein CVS53_02701 [Microbacterium oxydans]